MGLANNCNKLIIPTRSCEVLLSFPVHLSSWGNGLKSLTYDRCTPFSRAPVISFDCRSGNLTCSLSLASLACLRTRTFFFFLFDLTVILPLFQNSTHFLVSHNSKSQQITSMLDFPNHTVHSAVFVYFMYKYIEHWYASHIIYFKQYTNNCTLFEYGISEVWIALLERFWLNTSENVPFLAYKGDRKSDFCISMKWLLFEVGENREKKCVLCWRTLYTRRKACFPKNEWVVEVSPMRCGDGAPRGPTLLTCSCGT